jgi:hypothetical protein
MGSMRQLGVALATLMFATTPASADVFRLKLDSTGVATTFEASSADGCVDTSGELVFFASALDGTFAFFAGTRTDHCGEDGPVESYFFAAGPVDLASNGLSSATVSGAFDAYAYSGDTSTPTTFEYTLSFSGRGAVSTQTSHFASGGGGVTLSYTTARTRAATASGALLVDGEPAAITSARLGMVSGGDLVVVR